MLKMPSDYIAGPGATPYNAQKITVEKVEGFYSMHFKSLGESAERGGRESRDRKVGWRGRGREGRESRRRMKMNG